MTRWALRPGESGAGGTQVQVRLPSANDQRIELGIVKRIHQVARSIVGCVAETGRVLAAE